MLETVTDLTALIQASVPVLVCVAAACRGSHTQGCETRHRGREHACNTHVYTDGKPLTTPLCRSDRRRQSKEMHCRANQTGIVLRPQTVTDLMTNSTLGMVLSYRCHQQQVKSIQCSFSYLHA
jgi:hypothetical protein